VVGKPKIDNAARRNLFNGVGHGVFVNALAAITRMA